MSKKYPDISIKFNNGTVVLPQNKDTFVIAFAGGFDEELGYEGLKEAIFNIIPEDKIEEMLSKGINVYSELYGKAYSKLVPDICYMDLSGDVELLTPEQLEEAMDERGDKDGLI